MDLCCEPEIAADRATVLARVAGTADLLTVCRDEAGRVGIAAPMPVLPYTYKSRT
jgi:hypothetical protein